MNNGLKALKEHKGVLKILGHKYCEEWENLKDIEKELKALEIISEHIIINEKNGYVEFQCDFSLPTNYKYENEEHFNEKIDLLKEVLLWD